MTQKQKQFMADIVNDIVHSTSNDVKYATEHKAALAKLFTKTLQDNGWYPCDEAVGAILSNVIENKSRGMF